MEDAMGFTSIIDTKNLKERKYIGELVVLVYVRTTIRCIFNKQNVRLYLDLFC
jgi:hypothetical protein